LLQCVELLCVINHATKDLQQRLLMLQIWFVRSTMPRRIYNEGYWCSKYGSYGRPCPGGFTVKITDSPHMVCTVNYATEDLLHRILDYSKYCLLCCHVQMKRDQRLKQRREQYRVRRERNRRATGIQVGKTKMMAEFQTPPTHSSSRVYTFYTCMYFSNYWTCNSLF